MRRLVTNADDLGWSEAVTSGILQAHREGIVTSTTLMTNLPGAAEALDQARRAGLGVGVHLNLTEGEPLSPPGEVAPIVDSSGRFQRSLPLLFCRAWWSGAARRAIGRELGAQVARALDVGLEPTHLDSHKHVHLHPAILPLVIEVARRHGIRAVRTTVEAPLRGLSAHVPAHWGLWARLRQRANALTALRWGRRAQAAIRRAGLATTDWFAGVRLTGGLTAGFLCCLLEQAPEGTLELMAHPGLAEPGPARPTRLGESRPRELAALCDPQVREAAQRLHWDLVTYRDIGHG